MEGGGGAPGGPQRGGLRACARRGGGANETEWTCGWASSAAGAHVLARASKRVWASRVTPTPMRWAASSAAATASWPEPGRTEQRGVRGRSTRGSERTLRHSRLPGKHAEARKVQAGLARSPAPSWQRAPRSRRGASAGRRGGGEAFSALARGPSVPSERNLHAARTSGAKSAGGGVRSRTSCSRNGKCKAGFSQREKRVGASDPAACTPNSPGQPNVEQGPLKTAAIGAEQDPLILIP